METILKIPKKLWILLPVLILVSAIAMGFVLLKERPNEEALSISGNIEATDVALSFRIAGRIEQRLVSEGEIIKEGQTVAYLNQTELQQQVLLSRAELAAARAALAELEAGSRPEEIAGAKAALNRAEANLSALLAGSRRQEIAAAQAVLNRATAEADRSRAEAGRQEYLYQNGIAPEREYDAALAAFEVARARVEESLEQLKLVKEGPRPEEIEAARAAVAEAQEQYNLVKKGPRRETIEQARARVEQAEQALALNETRMSYSILRSPFAGVVLSEQLESGEYVSPGAPVVVVGDLENVWLRGFINETDLGRVKHGLPVRVRADTYPDKYYPGVVSFIASEAEFTPKNIQTEEQRVKLVYRVKIDIANPAMELKPGMPADAEIVLATGE